VHDLSLYLLELLENSVRAGASRVRTRIVLDEKRDRLTIAVEDDGDGLAVAPDQALDPFYTTKRDKKTGLGLSLLREAAEQAGGALTLGSSSRFGGLAVEVTMTLGHLDRPPLGDVATTVAVMAATNPGVEFTVEASDGRERCVTGGAELARGGDLLRALTRKADIPRPETIAEEPPPTAASSGEEPVLRTTGRSR